MKYVYLVRSGEFVKIGISVQPVRRAAQFLQGDRTLRPDGLTTRPLLVHSINSTRHYEKYLHKELVAYRVIGEWYSADCLDHPVMQRFLAKAMVIQDVKKRRYMNVTFFVQAADEKFFKRAQVMLKAHGIPLSRFLVKALRKEFPTLEFEPKKKKISVTLNFDGVDGRS